MTLVLVFNAANYRKNYHLFNAVCIQYEISANSIEIFIIINIKNAFVKPYYTKKYLTLLSCTIEYACRYRYTIVCIKCLTSSMIFFCIFLKKVICVPEELFWFNGELKKIYNISFAFSH